MKQQGLVMVFALLILASLTILGVASVSSSLMQQKMAQSMQKQALAFDAAEAAIAGVMFESEDSVLLSGGGADDPLSEARQGPSTEDLNQPPLTCFANDPWVDRFVTNTGLERGKKHTVAGNYETNPETTSWSKTAFIRERACIGSSNVIGGSNISCHIFAVRGCGQLAGSKYAIANTVRASVFAPATE